MSDEERNFTTRKIIAEKIKNQEIVPVEILKGSYAYLKPLNKSSKEDAFDEGGETIELVGDWFLNVDVTTEEGRIKNMFGVTGPDKIFEILDSLIEKRDGVLGYLVVDAEKLPVKKLKGQEGLKHKVMRMSRYPVTLPDYLIILFMED